LFFGLLQTVGKIDFLLVSNELKHFGSHTICVFVSDFPICSQKCWTVVFQENQGNSMQFAASMLHIYTAASKQHGDSVYRSLVKLLFSDVAHARTMAHVNVDFF
jgi:hypothetical protein